MESDQANRLKSLLKELKIGVIYPLKSSFWGQKCGFKSEGKALTNHNYQKAFYPPGGKYAPA